MVTAETRRFRQWAATVFFGLLTTALAALLIAHVAGEIRGRLARADARRVVTAVALASPPLGMDAGEGEPDALYARLGGSGLGISLSRFRAAYVYIHLRPAGHNTLEAYYREPGQIESKG